MRACPRLCIDDLCHGNREMTLCGGSYCYECNERTCGDSHCDDCQRRYEADDWDDMEEGQ